MQGRIVQQRVSVAGYEWDDTILGEAADDANIWFQELQQSRERPSTKMPENRFS